MKLFKKKGNNKGFSLVELIVVVAIMAVLLGVLVPTLIRHVESSKLGKDKQALDNLKEAVEIALANEKYMDITLEPTELFANKSVNLSKLVSGDSTTAFVEEVKANLGNKSTIALSSKLASDGTEIKISIKDGACKITVKCKAKTGSDYNFTIGDTSSEPATSGGATSAEATS